MHLLIIERIKFKNSMQISISLKFYFLLSKYQMLQPNNCPNQLYSHPQMIHPHPPPQSKIINSKDEAIQQLIYENTMLKKQLSQLMLKNAASTPIQQLHNLNGLDTAVTTMRPSATHTGSGMNSLSNSIEFIQNLNKTKGKISLGKEKKDNICQETTQDEEKLMRQRQMKRANRHSVDNLCYEYQQPHQNNPNHQTKQIFYQNPYHHGNNIPLVVQPQQIQARLQQHLNNTLSYPRNHQEKYLTEQEMYREKMMKLKGRRNSQSKRLSQEKQVIKIAEPINCVPGFYSNSVQFTQNYETRQPQNNQRVQNIECLRTAHDVLKSKINSSEQNSISKGKLNSSFSQKTLSNQNSFNQIPLAQQNKPSEQTKIIPRYTPKNFSREKQSKTCQQQKITNISILNNNGSEKTVERKPTETSSQAQSKQEIKVLSSLKNEEKKVCLKEPRGRIYLDDEAEGNRTKRAHSRTSSNIASGKPSSLKQTEMQNQSTARNNKKPQVPKTINIAQSQLTYIDADSFKKQNPTNKNLTLNEKIMMKKNSNQVYLDEDEGQKSKFKGSSKQKEPKEATKPMKQAKNVNNVTEQRSQKSHNDQIVSIEEIHMIEIERKDLHKVVNQTPKISMPPTPKQVNNSFSKNKNLYNQIYCEESKKDLHS